MPAATQSEPKGASIIAALGDFDLPLELDRPDLFARGESKPVCFRFSFCEVPFRCMATREDGHPILTLTGDLGALPFTADGLGRRQAVQSVVETARRRSGLEWHVTPQQQIVVKGGIALDLPLTPVAVIAGAVTVLLRARPFLDALLEALSASAQPGGNATTCPG
jgi:hypothetical protein